MRKLIKRTFIAGLFLIFIYSLALLPVALAQAGGGGGGGGGGGEDATPPVTTKTYGEPNTAGLIEILSCGSSVAVNGHFITTGTTITLNAEDDSGVESTSYAILVPADCGEGVLAYAGLTDSQLYSSVSYGESAQGLCNDAVDDPDTPETETQDCVASYWNYQTDGFAQAGHFMIGEESLHQICFFSSDIAGNQENVQCQVALVDDSAPVINSAEVDNEIIDLEYYSGSNNDFQGHKCTWLIINATDTHEVEVSVNVGGVLQQMFQNIDGLSGFDAEAYKVYLADSMHNMSAAELHEDGLYYNWFCPAVHIPHLLDSGVLGGSGSYDAFSRLLSEELVLGEFEVSVLAKDAAGNEAETSANLKIVDLTVPLEDGWNLRSTPIELEGDTFWYTDGIDAVLRFNDETQSWELVTDNSIEPLDALYIHATDQVQIGYIFERDLTLPPVRALHAGWSLVGVALQLSDSSYLSGGDYCSQESYNLWNCYLTYLSNDYTYIGEAFGPVIYDSNGNRALEVVISPNQYIYHQNDWSYLYFQQSNWVWVPQISESGASPDNYYDQNVVNFGGYWVFMQKDDLLPGFTTTPLPVESNT